MQGCSAGMLPVECGANYYEVYVTTNGAKPVEHGDAVCYSIGLDREEFTTLLEKMGRATEIKHFQKEYKEYVYNDVVVHNYMNNETRVFRNTPVLVKKGKGCVVCAYNRSKLTFLNVPSTKTIHDIQCVRRLIFRVNNRLFVNFQAAAPPGPEGSSDVTYTVCINYNHEQNVDMDSMGDALVKLCAILGLSF